MIPGKFGGFHKKFGSALRPNGISTAFFSRMPTFSRNFAMACGGECGDVICYGENYDGAYAFDYASFPQLGRGKSKMEIAVENSYFSTFSTELSTRVFHRLVEEQYALWINITQK